MVAGKIFTTLDWHSKSLANKELLRQAGGCGCFDCCTTFQFDAITEFVQDEGGDTALCPYCGTDSVIPSTDKSLLTKMSDEWMT